MQRSLFNKKLKAHEITQGPDRKLQLVISFFLALVFFSAPFPSVLLLFRYHFIFAHFEFFVLGTVLGPRILTLVSLSVFLSCLVSSKDTKRGSHISK